VPVYLPRPCVLILLLPSLTVGWPLASAVAIDVGLDRQLFVDQALIEYREGVDLVLHPGAVHPGLVLAASMPWEGQSISLGGSVVFDPAEALWKMWYTAQAETSRICYATSADGIHWQRPDLGAGDNVVLPQASWPSVMLRASADEGCRYSMVCVEETPPTPVYASFTSPDGISWTRCGSTHEGVGPITAAWDAGRRMCLAVYTPAETDGFALAASTDLVDWSPLARLPIAGADTRTLPPRSMALLPLGAVCVGFPWRQDGIGLLTTRDLHTWRDPGFAEPVLAPSGGLTIPSTASSPVSHDGRLFLYYTVAGKDGRPTGIALATWREDGLVSAQGGHRPGVLLTRSFTLQGDRLVLNAEAPGGIRVQVETGGGEVPAGFSTEDCDPFNGDALRYVVSWNSSPDLARLRGHTIRLRFTVYQADLYSFRLETANSP